WLQACYERASAYNLQFPTPLEENEVNGIAKSIAKWTFSNFTQHSFNDYVFKTHTSEIQSIRGKRSRGGGRPRDENSLSSTKPWMDFGISRSTYYRRLLHLK
ncbi:replicase, partial [Pectobacterium carotovorum subsp. carotovorum]